ncbi:MAG: hypothetical protein GF353_02820 [Candidatus Lokiarchaeota archaeon]|nr:hypothetical protein [Candidatus Lokiarchaeota archaeon]
MSLNSEKKNPINQIKRELCNVNIDKIQELRKECQDIVELGLSDGNLDQNPHIKAIWDEIKQKVGYSIGDFKEYIRKKKVIDKIFLQDLKLNNYGQVILLLEFEIIIDKIAREVFYYIFSKIVRQISRIIELYQKITNEKALILLAMRKMKATTDTEEWVRVKLEELIIDRLIKRQRELVVIFNAMDKPFLVNGFIFSRLTDSSLNEGIEELKLKKSLIFEDIKPLKLSSEIISPISYCIAYDLIKRFETFEKKRRNKVEDIKKKKKKKKEEKKRIVRERQEQSTFNWIERRITSSLMRINSSGINPNQLYWKDKDTKIATDNLKMHSEKGKNPLFLFTEYFSFAIEKIKSFTDDVRLPEKEKIKKVVKNISEKTLANRIGHSPDEEEVINMIDGERYEISKQIAMKIGKLLDKALYTKFKKKRR